MSPGPPSIAVRRLSSLEDLAAAEHLFTQLWAGPGGVPMRADMLRALEMSGNYLSGAFEEDGRLVGACAGFAAVHSPGEPPALHSHVAAVVPDRRRAGIGLTLKLDQREWALAHGMPVVTWTFDPLVRRNAIFNLSRLAARAVRYVEDCYGPLDDEINQGDSTDRLVVVWDLESPAVLAAVAGTPLVVDGAPGRETYRIPPDVEALRRADPAGARAARRESRAVLGGLLAAGGAILGVDAAGDYVLGEQP